VGKVAGACRCHTLPSSSEVENGQSYISTSPLCLHGSYRVTFTIFFFRSSLIWDVTQRILVVSYLRFGTSYRSHLQGSRNVGNKLRCVTYQKSEYLIYTAAGAWNHTPHLFAMQRLITKDSPPLPTHSTLITFTSACSVTRHQWRFSGLATPQTSTHRFHLFSMGPPRHSMHETWRFRFITRTKIPPLIFQRLGFHYIVIVSSNGSLSHLGHWCCTEIYGLWFLLVTLAWKLSHQSMYQSTPTQGTRTLCLSGLSACFASCSSYDQSPDFKVAWTGSYTFFVQRTRNVQEINAPRGGHVCPDVR
jgi:hypothetical protein